MSRTDHSGKGIDGSRYRTQRVWLDHLRILAGLPYPSWALIPVVMALIRKRLPGTVASFVWFDQGSAQPLALWVDPPIAAAYAGFVDHYEKILVELPLRLMLDTHGRIIRQIEHLPEYETSEHYRRVFVPYGIHWGMAGPVSLGGGQVGVASLCRPHAEGPYGDLDWDTWARVTSILGGLGRMENSWLSLSPAPFRREMRVTTLWLARDGKILAQGEDSYALLFFAHAGRFGAPDWMRDDQLALPQPVRTVLQSLWQDPRGHVRSELVMDLNYCSIRFVLEKMPVRALAEESVVSLSIHHRQKLDLALAEALWGWPMSPQEKRIVIASARHPSLGDLARVLGLTVGTLKSYINRLQRRFNVDSRDELIAQVMADSSDSGI